MPFIVSIWEILNELAPWLFLGMAISGLLHVFLPTSFVRRRFTGMGGVVRAVLFGVPLPLCSCGVIPAAIGLKKDGAGNGAAIGFLISTPQTGIDSILVSGSFLGWPFAIFKIFAALLTGLAGGWLTEYVQPRQEKTNDSGETRKSLSWERWLPRAMNHGLEIVRSIWIWLVLGVLISAAINTLLPQSWIDSVRNLDRTFAVLTVLMLSIPLYVCATASIPIAAALVANGFPPSAALVFLFAGPATNAATIGTIYKEFGIRVLLIYLTVLVLGSLVFGYLFEQFFAMPSQPLSHSHDAHISWIASLASLALIGLLLKFGWDDIRRLFRSSPKEGRRIGLKGLHCQGCVNSLESALLKNRKVNSVKIDLSTQTALVTGTISDAELAEVVRRAGFDVSSLDGSES